jgi:hypothetical protein
MGSTAVEVATDNAALIDMAGRARFDLFVIDADAAAGSAGPAAGGDAQAVRDLVAQLRDSEAAAVRAANPSPEAGEDASCSAARRPSPLVGITSRPADKAWLLAAGFCLVLAKPLTRAAVQEAIRAVLAPTTAGIEAARGGTLEGGSHADGVQAEGGAAEVGHGEEGNAALTGPAAVRILIVEGAPTLMLSPCSLLPQNTSDIIGSDLGNHKILKYATMTNGPSLPYKVKLSKSAVQWWKLQGMCMP